MKASQGWVKDLDRFGMQGRDYSSLLAHPMESIQQYTYFINTDVKAGQNTAQTALPPNNLAMVRDAEFKYVRYYGGTTVKGTTSRKVQEEFYDLGPNRQDALELHNKSEWAKDQGAPWKVSPKEAKKRDEMKMLLEKAMDDGVLATKPRDIPPLCMQPRAKTVTNAWGPDVAATPEVYQVICYTQHSYKYTLQVWKKGKWRDVPRTTDQIPTTLCGTNGPVLFQAQPTQATCPTYRVARCRCDDAEEGRATYEEVVWEDYTSA